MGSSCVVISRTNDWIEIFHELRFTFKKLFLKNKYFQRLKNAKQCLHLSKTRIIKSLYVTWFSRQFRNQNASLYVKSRTWIMFQWKFCYTVNTNIVVCRIRKGISSSLFENQSSTKKFYISFSFHEKRDFRMINIVHYKSCKDVF